MIENARFKRIISVNGDKEFSRLVGMCIYEIQSYEKGYKIIAGVDEAGRGPLAGPVVAAAVILPCDMLIGGINDSKKLSASKRETLYDIIAENAIAVGVGIINEDMIDRINILNATIIAMETAICNLSPYEPDMILTDAVNLKNIQTAQLPIIKGDSLSLSIASASIIAKVTRDRIMRQYDSIYPQYGFLKHKGYGTEEHINAIRKFGLCRIHRASFVKKIIIQA